MSKLSEWTLWTFTAGLAVQGCIETSGISKAALLWALRNCVVIFGRVRFSHIPLSYLSTIIGSGLCQEGVPADWMGQTLVFAWNRSVDRWMKELFTEDTCLNKCGICGHREKASSLKDFSSWGQIHICAYPLFYCFTWSPAHSRLWKKSIIFSVL